MKVLILSEHLKNIWSLRLFLFIFIWHLPHITHKHVQQQLARKVVPCHIELCLIQWLEHQFNTCLGIGLKGCIVMTLSAMIWYIIDQYIVFWQENADVGSRVQRGCYSVLFLDQSCCWHMDKTWGWAKHQSSFTESLRNLEVFPSLLQSTVAKLENRI